MQTILPATLLSRWFTGNRCRLKSPSGTISRELPKRGTFAITIQPGGSVKCSRGTLWITRDGSLEDILLRSGEGQPFPDACGLLIEALDDSLLEIRGA